MSVALRRFLLEPVNNQTLLNLWPFDAESPEEAAEMWFRVWAFRRQSYEPARCKVSELPSGTVSRWTVSLVPQIVCEPDIKEVPR